MGASVVYDFYYFDYYYFAVLSYFGSEWYLSIDFKRGINFGFYFSALRKSLYLKVNA